MIKSFAILALFAAPTTETAPRCVTKRQIADAAMTMTPYAVQAVTAKCRAHLPAGSFLAAKGDALHTRLQAEGAGREASAAQVLIAMMGPEVPPVKETEALVKVMGSMMSGLMVKDLPVENCAEISGIMEALAPLPAENIGLLAASMTGIMSQNEKASGGKSTGKKVNPKFEICKGD
jgi:hypothetical protein